MSQFHVLCGKACAHQRLPHHELPNFSVEHSVRHILRNKWAGRRKERLHSRGHARRMA